MNTFKSIYKKNRLLILVYLSLGILITFLEIFNVSLFQKILDSFTDSHVRVSDIILYSILLISGYLLNYVENYPSTKLDSKIYLDFKINAINKIKSIDYKEYQKLGTGQLLQVIENGANAGKSILYSYRFRIIKELIPSLLFSLYFIGKMDLHIMFIILAGYIGVFIITNILLKYLYSIKKNVLINEEGLNKKLTRGFMELVVFRIYRRFNIEIAQCNEMEDNIVNGKSKMTMIHEAFFAIFAILIGFVKIIILSAQLFGWKLSVGEIVALLTLVDKAYSPIAIFNVLYIQKKLDQVAYDRYTDLLKLPDDHGFQLEKCNMEDQYGICIKNLTYAYENRNVVDNLSLQIKEGETVAFVGESGSGKSTLIKLILGLLKYQQGSIKIGQNELSSINLNQYYENISYISQESPTFDGTIRENIVFNKAVKDEDIINVLDMVMLKQLVSSLENGLDTEIGEKGLMLSGGERQRLALARIFFDSSKIIILDEATSAMDNITEGVVMRNLLQQFKDRTLIIIAHRLTTIKNVDQIYAIKNSSIVSHGTFEVLLESSEYFKQLWNNSQKKKN